MKFHDEASEYFQDKRKKQQKVLINIYTCPSASREKCKKKRKQKVTRAKKKQKR